MVLKFRFCLKFKGAKWYCLTCKQIEEQELPAAAKTVLKCNKDRLLDSIDGPTKYCIIHAMNKTSQKLKNHQEFVYQSLCKNDGDCEYYFPNTPFQKCAIDGICEDELGLDV